MKANAQTQKSLSGVIGFYSEPSKLLEATAKVREAGYEVFDTFTPYPVHGLEHAQGLKRSWLPFVTMGAGLAGCMTGFTVQYFTSVLDWPIIVAGKPFNSWPAFVPVMFEFTILLAGLFTVAFMFLANGLPNVTKRAFDPAITRDRFAIWIGKPKHPSDPVDYKAFDENEAQSFLKTLGAQDVKTVYHEGWF